MIYLEGFLPNLPVFGSVVMFGLPHQCTYVMIHVEGIFVIHVEGIFVINVRASYRTDITVMVDWA